MDRLSPVRVKTPDSPLSPSSSVGSLSTDSFEQTVKLTLQQEREMHETKLGKGPTQPEKAMLVKTYGPRLAAYLVRLKHQNTLAELDDDTLRSHAAHIVRLDAEIQAVQEQKRPQNHILYQTRVAEIRDLIKNQASDTKIAAKIGELHTFDASLQKEYEGQDPYPAKGVVQSSIDWAKSWFTDIDSRATPNQLIIEHSLAKLGLKNTSAAYIQALHEFKNLLLNPLELAKSSAALLGDLKNFVLEHPMLASQMAAQLAHLANLLGGNETAGAALQTLIFRQRIKYRALDLLTGKKNEHSYEEECKHPLNLRQLALLHVMSGLPYVVAAAEGAQGRTLGGRIGYEYAGPLGGIIGGLAHAKAQEVLAESLSRDTELLASSAMAVSDLTLLQKAFSSLDLSYEGILAVEKTWDATMKAAKPLINIIKTRGQIEKAGDFIKNFRKKGAKTAVSESAKTTFSKATTAEINTDALSSGLFAYNLYKFAKTMELLPDSLLAQLPETLNLGFLTQSIDWAKLPDKRPELLSMIRPFLSAKSNVALERGRETIIKDIFMLSRETLSLSHAQIAKKIQDTIKKQAEVLFALWAQ